MKSNRLLAGLLALAMTASLAGCGAASSAAPEATEIQSKEQLLLYKILII